AFDGVARDDAEVVGVDPVRAVSAVAGGVDPMPGSGGCQSTDGVSDVAAGGHDVHGEVSGGDGRVRDIRTVTPQCEGAAAHEQGRTGRAGDDSSGLLLHFPSPSLDDRALLGRWCGGPWGSLRAGCCVGGQCAVTGPEAVHSMDSPTSSSVRGQVMVPSVVPPSWLSLTAMPVSGVLPLLVTV